MQYLINITDSKTQPAQVNLYRRQPGGGYSVPLFLLHCQFSDIPESVFIYLVEPPLFTEEFRNALQLGQAQGCFQVGHAIIESDLRMKISLNRFIPCLVHQKLDMFRPFFVVDGDHPAPARGNDLITVKTKTADMPNRTGHSPPVKGAEALRGVFYYK